MGEIHDGRKAVIVYVWHPWYACPRPASSSLQDSGSIRRPVARTGALPVGRAMDLGRRPRVTDPLGAMRVSGSDGLSRSAGRE
jgi:hypothetical protein